MKKPCVNCGKVPRKNDKFCSKCGTELDDGSSPTLLRAYQALALFFGVFGLHNFYAGFYARGIGEIVFAGTGILYWKFLDQSSALSFPVIVIVIALCEMFKQKVDKKNRPMAETELLPSIMIFLLVLCVFLLFGLSFFALSSYNGDFWK